MGKVALVTGASAGIGESTVQQLLKQGYTTYAAARRVERMRGLEQQGALLLPLDLTDDASVVAAVERIRKEQGRLDVLVNNAGYGSYGAVEDVPLAEARRQFEVNIFGLARLVQLVTPLMRAQRSGRILNVSSIGGKFGEPLGAWYHATKFALEGFSDSLRMELKPFGVDVVVIEPGAIRTEWGQIALDGLEATSGHTDYAHQVAEKRALFSMSDTSASDPIVVANEIVKAVKARRPKTRYAVGGGAKPAILLATFLPDRTFDWMIGTMHRTFLRRSLKAAARTPNAPSLPASTKA